MVDVITHSIHDYLAKISALMESIRTSRQEIEAVAAVLEKQQLDTIRTPKLAQLYSSQYSHVRALLDEEELSYYRAQLSEPQCALNQECLRRLQLSV